MRTANSRKPQRHNGKARVEVWLADHWSDVYHESEVQELLSRRPEMAAHFHLAGTSRTYADFLKSNRE